MRAMVTGAAGFIGSHLCERLLAEGSEVVAVDSVTDYYDEAQKRDNLSALDKDSSCELLLEDGASPTCLSRLADVDVVFHLAGQPGVRLSWDQNFATYVERNIMLTQQLLERARAVTLPRFVYASSSSVYGNQPSYPVDELAVPRPYSPYGVTKLAAEHLCSLYAHNYGLSTVSLRFFTVYGPRQRPDMAFSKFIRNALKDQPVTITGDGSAIRDFTYVSDIVDALLLSARAEVAAGSVYNTCGRESINVSGTIEVLSEVLGRQVETDHVDPVPGDVQQTGGTSTLAERELGWEARTSLREGLEAQVEWERARL